MIINVKRSQRYMVSGAEQLQVVLQDHCSTLVFRWKINWPDLNPCVDEVLLITYAFETSACNFFSTAEHVQHYMLHRHVTSLAACVHSADVCH